MYWKLFSCVIWSVECDAIFTMNEGFVPSSTIVHNTLSLEDVATSTVTPTQTNLSGSSLFELLIIIVPSSIFFLICIIFLLVCFVYYLLWKRTQKMSKKILIEG